MALMHGGRKSALAGRGIGAFSMNGWRGALGAPEILAMSPQTRSPPLGSSANGVVVVSAAASASDRQATTAGSGADGTGPGIGAAVFVSKGRLLT